MFLGRYMVEGVFFFERSVNVLEEANRPLFGSTEDVVWNYGQYGLLGILMREEIMQGIKTLWLVDQRS